MNSRHGRFDPSTYRVVKSSHTVSVLRPSREFLARRETVHRRIWLHKNNRILGHWRNELNPSISQISKIALQDLGKNPSVKFLI